MQRMTSANNSLLRYSTRSTMKLKRVNVTNEDEGKMNWAPNAQEMVMVVNHDEKNKFVSFHFILAMLVVSR
jgi:hypothetical protein